MEQVRRRYMNAILLLQSIKNCTKHKSLKNYLKTELYKSQTTLLFRISKLKELQKSQDFNVEKLPKDIISFTLKTKKKKQHIKKILSTLLSKG